MDQDLFQNETFRKMSPEKREFIISFSQKQMPKKMSEAMPFLASWMKEAKTKQISFTKEETELITGLLCQGLNPNEKKTVDKMLALLHKNRRA